MRDLCLRCLCRARALPPLMSGKEWLSKSSITRLWRAGRLSNFSYLHQLNQLAGRTRNDISQYPVYVF